ncbi:hypothetical protein [Jejuia pallidilutea]|uniref:hypothetical protein n=1 Tax=Jejuia pallidilutea TaxID=504487 RepID=UPI0026D38A61
MSYGNDLSVLQQKNKDILESKLAKVANVFHDVSNLNVEEAILDFQMKNKINMLIMINNKHSFFENLFFKKLIHHIGFHIKTPFLVIPSKTE